MTYFDISKWEEEEAEEIKKLKTGFKLSPRADPFGHPSPRVPRLCSQLGQRADIPGPQAWQ